MESTVSNFWIGLNSLMSPRNWTWTDGLSFNFNEWAVSEPQNLSMNCGTVAIRDGYWSSDDCFKKKPYVCAVPTSYSKCELGWMYFEPTKSCYGHYNYGLLASNWSEAEKYCISQKAHLVFIHSHDEMKFISS